MIPRIITVHVSVNSLFLDCISALQNLFNSLQLSKIVIQHVSFDLFFTLLNKKRRHDTFFEKYVKVRRFANIPNSFFFFRWFFRGKYINFLKHSRIIITFYSLINSFPSKKAGSFSLAILKGKTNLLTLSLYFLFFFPWICFT